MEVIHHLGGLQVDPTSAVARSERLVLWSRLGSYDIAELDRALYRERSLFEWWAYILPMRDFPIYREAMRRHANGKAFSPARAEYRAQWMAANASFRRHVLARLRREGPLRSHDFEDRAALSWPSGGWNEGKNTGPMLELLWDQGVIAIVGRDGSQRIWDLVERRYPLQERRNEKVADEIVQRCDRAGIELVTCGGERLTYRTADDWERNRTQQIRDEAYVKRTRERVAARVRVEGLRNHWVAHTDTLGREFTPRTTLLSPFDQLIWNRKRTEDLFGFRFRLEIYVPVKDRRFGYFVMPILHGDRLIGRLDPFFDRAEGRLAIKAVYAESDAPADAAEDIAASIAELASWLGARDVTFGKRMPVKWRRALLSVA